jgi:hypothetical protein
VPYLKRLASAAAAAACVALAVPAAASAAPAAPAVSCDSGVTIGFLAGNHLNAGGWLNCFRPFPSVFRTVDATLYRNHVAVEYGRTDCLGSNAVCSVHSPAIANPKGIQLWCAISTANYQGLYKASHRTCWNG